jgi:IS4 transposase
MLSFPDPQNRPVGRLGGYKRQQSEALHRKARPKRGNIHHREELVETDFRMVVTKSEKQNKKFWFLTHEFEFSAKDIADYYGKRWILKYSSGS